MAPSDKQILCQFCFGCIHATKHCGKIETYSTTTDIKITIFKTKHIGADLYVFCFSYWKAIAPKKSLTWRFLDSFVQDGTRLQRSAFGNRTHNPIMANQHATQTSHARIARCNFSRPKQALQEVSTICSETADQRTKSCRNP